MRKRLLTISLLVLTIIACSSRKNLDSNPSVLLINKNNSKTWTLQSLQSKLKPLTVTVSNPVYQKQKTYEAFKLEEILTLISPSKPAQILVTALDNYALNLDLQTLPINQAYLAFKEVGKSNTDWELIPGKQVSPAPYWIVWSSDQVNRVLWPYQVAKIEIK